MDDEQQGLLINKSSCEIFCQGSAVTYEWEEVDKKRIIKLFLDGLQQAFGLSKVGLTGVVIAKGNQGTETDYI